MKRAHARRQVGIAPICSPGNFTRIMSLEAYTSEPKTSKFHYPIYQSDEPVKNWTG